MDLITLTTENIDAEHICCAIADKKSINGVKAKKEWIADRLKEGLKFRKLNARGKVFIEYLPAEKAWVPIEAAGYLFINCHWVSGSYKGQGYGKELLAQCEADAQETNGVVVMVGKKKLTYLSDKAFFIKQGYEVCDSCPPQFELLVKRFNPKATRPRFKECARQGMEKGIKGIDVFYTAQCPFTTTYIELIRPAVAASGYPVRIHHIQNREEAQNHCCPITTYSVFVDGNYYNNEILTIARLEKLIEKQSE